MGVMLGRRRQRAYPVCFGVVLLLLVGTFCLCVKDAVQRHVLHAPQGWDCHDAQQDDPCVAEWIRREYLHAPPSAHVPYRLTDVSNQGRSDPSAGQADYILNELLSNKSNGFFVECGAMDGEYASNTLYMERNLGWHGILIEANPHNYAELLKRKRKAWTVPACLSLDSRPTKVTFQAGLDDGRGLSHALGHIDQSGSTRMRSLIVGQESELLQVQCFPLYSILLAVGRTSIDYFSLDVEGHELAVLKTIPWHKVDIKTLSVEYEHIPEGEEALVTYMEGNGYRAVYKFDDDVKDWIFVKT